jgi:hypothetical protein
MGTLLKSLLSPALSALSGWQGYLAALLIGAALAGGGTWRVMSWREQAHQAQVVTKTVKQIVYQDRVTEKVVTKYVAVQAKAAENTKAIIQEIPVHVTPEADARCTVNLGTVRLWQRAVHGTVPGPSAGTDDAPSGLACSDMAKAIAEVAGQYDATANQLAALQSWVREQRSLTAP